MDLLRVEFDIHHIAVLSRKSPEEHALIRFIISTLATPEETENFVKKDLRVIKKNDKRIYTVKLTSGRKTRISPLDKKTYEILLQISKKKRNKERVFKFTRKQIDEIIKKYSPPGRKYDFKKLRDAVIRILKDCIFFNEDYVKYFIEGTNFNKVLDFVYDFHPLYSGMWDLDDDEVAEDFIADFTKYTGITDVRKIAEIIGECENRIKKLINNHFKKSII